ncbi:MAG: hypothetical protein WC444_06825 [Candidatus Paceibacterota bacterium]
MQYLKIFYWFLFLILASAISFAGSWCYQETANASTAGDGSCGLEYTGVYTCSGTWNDAGEHNCSYVFDGNWSSSGSAASGQETYLYINYSVPVNATSNSVWNIKDTAGVENLSLGDCWADPIMVYAYSDYTGGDTTEWRCWNGTHWRMLSADVGSIPLYEESMYWYDNTTGASSCTYSSGAWNIKAGDICTLNTNIDVLGNSVLVNGSGSVTLTADLYNISKFEIYGTNFIIKGGSVTVE